MTVNEIKELIQVVNDSGIAELEVQRGDDRVRIRRATGVAQEYVLPPTAIMPSTSMSAAGAPMSSSTAQPQLAAAHTVAPVEPANAVAEAERVYVKSPIVGTFYE